MAEAGWPLRVLKTMASPDDVVRLVDWALPIQERHFRFAAESSEQLAAVENPNEES